MRVIHAQLRPVSPSSVWRARDQQLGPVGCEVDVSINIHSSLELCESVLGLKVKCQQPGLVLPLHTMADLTPVAFLTLLAVMPLSPACLDSIPASFTSLLIISAIGIVRRVIGTCMCARLHEDDVVEEHLCRQIAMSARAGSKKTRREGSGAQRTVTSAFLLTLQLEWALTIFLTVARGYIFCPGAISSSRRAVEDWIRRCRSAW